MPRRQFDLTLGLDTLTPITTIHERVKVWGEQSGKHIDLQVGFVCAAASWAIVCYVCVFVGV